MAAVALITTTTNNSNNLTLRPLYPGKEPRDPLNTRLGKPQTAHRNIEVSRAI
jgi:hypothetical protein